MKLKSVIFIIAISSFITAFGQNHKDKNIIYWSKNYKLTWNDFQGVPNDSHKSIVASTASDFKKDLLYTNGVIKINSSAMFYKRKSWVKKNLSDSFVLKHEQGHFDIAEIYARKFRKTLLNTKFRARNIKKKFIQIYNDLFAQMNQYQDLYDQQTMHSKNKAEQIEWNKKIAAELSALKAYSNPMLKIKYKK